MIHFDEVQHQGGRDVYWRNGWSVDFVQTALGGVSVTVYSPITQESFRYALDNFDQMNHDDLADVILSGRALEIP